MAGEVSSGGRMSALAIDLFSGLGGWADHQPPENDALNYFGGNRMNSCLRPNYRRARALALEIEAAKEHLEECRADPSFSLDDIDELRAELHHLQHEFFLAGVTSEYEL
jgi:hypothetical protein